MAAWLGTRKMAQKQADFAPREAASEAKDSHDAGVAANGDDLGDSADPVFRRPSGEVPALTCDEARNIVTQVGEELAFDPPDVRAPAFASSVSDWVDPHGFWAASSSSPPYAAITKNSQALSVEIMTTRGECTAARDVGKSLAHWVDDLRRRYDARLEHPNAMPLAEAASDPILDDATTTHAEVDTVELLADRLASLHAALGAEADPILKAARDRYFPEFGPDAWSRVVLAAAVRAYVPLVDPHGAWAPLDEEASVYEIDLDANPPVPLWEKVLRTAAGARIESGALAPLKDGDVVVELDHMMIAGLSLEQVDQLGIVSAGSHDPIDARVLRDGETKLRTIRLESPAPADDSAPEVRDDLESHRVAYGDADVGVVAIREVRDDLGEALARTVR
ncbi:MAG: hypothetical protein ACRELY_15735, partial [Polyangiaceae bacterium]